MALLHRSVPLLEPDSPSTIYHIYAKTLPYRPTTPIMDMLLQKVLLNTMHKSKTYLSLSNHLQCPRATVVVVNDSDWCSVIRESVSYERQ